MKVLQRTLEGGIKVATGNRIKDQLAAIMEAEPETQANEDWLAATWICMHTHIGKWLVLEHNTADALQGGGNPARGIAYQILRRYRQTDIPRCRQELAADGSYPWPTDEAERRQARAKGGAPG